MAPGQGFAIGGQSRTAQGWDVWPPSKPPVPFSATPCYELIHLAGS